MKRLGFIGTGGMGAPMAANLMKAGYALIVFDVRREATRPLEAEGAQYRPSPREVAEASEVVLSMLPVDQAVATVATGAGGLVEATGGARLWIDLSSIDRGTMLDVDRALRSRGWTVLDASVNGVEEQAQSRTLAIRVSGPREVADRCRPIWEALGNRLTYVGALGNAKLVKTAMAMLAAVDTLMTVEVFNWAAGAGVAPEIMHDVLRDSPRYCESTQRICEKIVSGRFKARKSWMPKDVGFGLAQGQEQGTPLPFTALAQQLFQVARANGVDGYEATGIACKTYALLNGAPSGARTERTDPGVPR